MTNYLYPLAFCPHHHHSRQSCREECGFLGYKTDWGGLGCEREGSPVKLHSGEVWRVITLAFITSCMVDCILYCSGTGRIIHLHWLSYCRRLYGSGNEYQLEMSGWFGWPFTFLRIATVIVVSLLLSSFYSMELLKYRRWGFYTEREMVLLREKLAMKSCVEKIICICFFWSSTLSLVCST